MIKKQKNETPHEQNLREFQDRLKTGNLDKLDKTRINSFISKYPSKNWTYNDVVAECLANEKFCAKMSKDPMKQNRDETPTIIKIGAIKLPASGKDNIRFEIKTGKMVKGEKAGIKYTKSADFKIKYKGKTYYGSQKTLHDTGGAQGNQARETILNFVRVGNIKHNAIAIIDGYKEKTDELGVYTSDEFNEIKATKKDLITKEQPEKGKKTNNNQTK